jgi:hypothetical protein
MRREDFFVPEGREIFFSERVIAHKIDGAIVLNRF